MPKQKLNKIFSSKQKFEQQKYRKKNSDNRNPKNNLQRLGIMHR